MRYVCVMSLLHPELAPYFLKACAKVNDALTPLNTVGMVGASCHLFRNQNTGEIELSVLEPSEHDFLDAGHHLLVPHGYGLGKEPQVLVSEYKRGSDFLNGAFKGAHIDLLVLSSLFYDPEFIGRAPGPNMMQSPLADKEENWVNTFAEVDAEAILNVNKYGDEQSGRELSEFILRTGKYKSVATTGGNLTGHSRWAPDGAIYSSNGAELFLKI